MNSWEEVFEEACPTFKTELQTLRDCSGDKLSKDWLGKRTYTLSLFDQLEKVYAHMGKTERRLMRAGLQRMHVVLSSEKDQKIRREEARASIFAIFMHVSTTLASSFEQFMDVVLNTRRLLEEARSESIKGG